jgi:hypothetical protein
VHNIKRVASPMSAKQFLKVILTQGYDRRLQCIAIWEV